jgi:hypothetical protein
MHALDAFTQPHNIRVARGYLPDTLSSISGLLSSVNPDGCPPTVWAEKYSILERGCATVTGLFPGEELTRILSDCRTLERVAWCHVGEPWRGNSASDDSALELERGQGNPHEILARYCDHLESRDDRNADLYRGILTAWNTRLAYADDTACIPLIVENPQAPQASVACPSARLLPLQANLAPFRFATDEDHISTPNLLHGDDAWKFNSHVRDALRAVRTLHDSPRQADLYRLSVRFQAQDSAYTGCSFQLALASILHFAMRRSQEQRIHESLSPDVVITGGLDADGKTIGLGAEQIIPKLTATFFSPYSHFAFPRADDDAVNAALATLHDSFPHRALRTIPVRDLRDLVSNREIVRITSVPFRKQVRSFVRRHAERIALSSLVAALLAVVYVFLFVFDFDSNPMIVEVADSVFYVKNRSGKVLWTEEATSSDRRGIKFLYTPPPWSVILDIDNDGSNEVVLGNNGRERGVSNRLNCYRANKEIAWSTQQLGEPVETGEGRYLDIVYGTDAIIADTMNGRRDIFIATASDYYPTFLYSIDASDGGVVHSRYYHAGSIRDLTVSDQIIPGQRMLFAGGVHNGFREGALAVFDIRHVSGCSPQAASYELISPEYTPGTELYYIRFPQTDLGKLLDEAASCFARINMIDSIGFEVAINQFFTFETGGPSEIFIRFDRDFTPTEMRTSSSFDKYFRQFREKGDLEHPLDAMYKQRYLESILFWNGKIFQARPTAVMKKRS